MSQFRIEHDSMGELKVPAKALYGAQTQRAVDNFPISGMRLPRSFIRSLGLVKAAAADANFLLGLVVLSFMHEVRIDLMAYLFGDLLEIMIALVVFATLAAAVMAAGQYALKQNEIGRAHV